MASNFLLELIRVSEKAAEIARAIRAEKDLFALLIEEKDAKEKNQRFIRDFKTLADVLIQETIRHDLSNKFPALNPNEIRGEECNKFTNALGESLLVEVKASQTDTAQLLAKVLDNNVKAAEILASVVHSHPQCDISEQLARTKALDFPLEQFSIWIDPIDSTAEYTQGKDELVSCDEVCSSGLPCVTVLIGVYNRVTGEPLIGVVNQPFHRFQLNSNSWVGRCEWGVNYNGSKISSIPSVSPSSSNGHLKGKVLLSNCEDEKTKQLLLKHYEVLYAAGAGYKILCVALGVVDAYILSKATTFRWDLCGPHAILSVWDGGIIRYQEMVKSGSQLQIAYHEGEEQKWCNTEGIIAYKNKNVIEQIYQLFQQTISNT